jgi:hypothetical protein
MSRPGVISVRSINQYRRRDVIAYLGLRYYLNNKAAQQDVWARDIATQLERGREGGGYLLVKHFKEINEQGRAEHRDIYIPRPNEAIAEAALIDACAKSGGDFQSNENVYSYVLARGAERDGVFLNYMKGLRSRHASIADACRGLPGSDVCFRDLKSFYPSINISLAHRVWERACHSSTIESYFKDLGHKLLDRHGEESGGHLLIGPIFSHLIGNLVLKDIDDLAGGERVRYLRYVDDMTLVGQRAHVSEALKRIGDKVDALGLSLHPDESPKSLDVPASRWIVSEHDFEHDPSKYSWMTLVGDIKYLLLWHPDRAKELGGIFRSEGIGIPMLDYREAVREAAYFRRSIQRMRWRWYRRKSKSITPASVLRQAKTLRDKYMRELSSLGEALSSADAFNTKRFIPMSRYRVGRLSYLADPDTLLEASKVVAEQPLLRFHAEVARAVATKSLDRLLPLGANAAQAAAQPLRALGAEVSLGRPPETEVEEQALAVLALNGIQPSGVVFQRGINELHQLAVEGSSLELMRSKSAFIAEISSLHGLGAPRHLQVLDTAFDLDEDLALDAVDQANASMSL